MRSSLNSRASYAKRYEELCQRVLTERLYTEAAFMTSKKDDPSGDSLREPHPDLAFLPFIQSLLASVKIAVNC